jgi:hypothetical protein
MAVRQEGPVTIIPQRYTSPAGVCVRRTRPTEMAVLILHYQNERPLTVVLQASRRSNCVDSEEGGRYAGNPRDGWCFLWRGLLFETVWLGHSQRD